MNNAPRILIADDEAVNRKILGWTLAEAGFRVLDAANGSEACALAEEHRPDLILLDVLMPGEDGFAVCRRLRETAATRDIPVIFISGLSDFSDKMRGMEQGAVDYIAKPFSRQEVLDKIRLHLRAR